MTLEVTLPLTIVETIVDPSPTGPKRAGVISVRRMARRGLGVAVEFGRPRPELLDLDFESMTDDEIARLGCAEEGDGSTRQAKRVAVAKNQNPRPQERPGAGIANRTSSLIVPI